jgi:peptidoglycan/xylan/chitin deacetylase (PgdA/CDA1 family)
MIINLCFHGIGTILHERERGESRYWLSEERFLRILDEVWESPRVRLSFDDGNRSDVDTALPALQQRSLPATFFPLAGRLDDPASLAPADLRGLRAVGMTVGSHGWTHTPLRGLDEADARREIVDARAALAEASNGEVIDAALPLGRYDRQVLARLKRSGYRRVFTSDRMPARPDSWLQPRYSVSAWDTAESIHAVITHRPGFRELRNVLAGGVKRIR